MTRTEFLLARIEDYRAHANGWCEDYAPCAEKDHPGHESPAYVLAECEAKRRLMDWYAESVDYPDIEEFLAVLALPYADHPDYREEWRP